MNHRRLLVAVAAGALVPLAGCADDGPQAVVSSPAGISPSGIVIEIDSLDNTFRPDRIEVEIGTEVVWRNVGHNEHDVLAVEGDWGIEKGDFAPGAEYRHVFTKPGENRYYCTVHGIPDAGMVGTVIVTEPV